ncbi:MAG: hypothetical protein QM688_14765 [Sphingomonas bacterium]
MRPLSGQAAHHHSPPGCSTAIINPARVRGHGAGRGRMRAIRPAATPTRASVARAASASPRGGGHRGGWGSRQAATRPRP